jgi:hydrogenase maturation protein HypF
MLPYAPLHALLFDAGAPRALVMTSGNRSNEPIAYSDADARARLSDIADAIVVGERPIARRADDSVAVAGALGPAILRRSRGNAPGVAARLPATGPILALGADLKNTVTLVVDGQAIVSPHIGDLEHLGSFASFVEAIDDLLAMYALRAADIRIVHDLHPHYHSTRHAERLGGERVAVQHHHAHIASVLAEHAVADETVLGLALDGTGYGTDATIWGCEFLAGGLRTGFERVASLAPYTLPGGDSAARFPALCAVGVTAGLALPPLEREPFAFPTEALLGRALIARDVQTHRTTSAGRIFDAVAALCGFTGRISFEGQAAMWLEHAAEQAPDGREYHVDFDGKRLDVGDLLEAIAADRAAGVAVGAIARGFHAALAGGLTAAADRIAGERGISTIVLSGGVWQNALLCSDVVDRLRRRSYRLLTNRGVPVNDGGISLGQAAIAAYRYAV